MILIVAGGLNLFSKGKKISQKFQFIMWFSGFRGPVSFALALNSTYIFNRNQSGEIMLTLTLIYLIQNVNLLSLNNNPIFRFLSLAVYYSQSAINYELEKPKK